MSGPDQFVVVNPAARVWRCTLCGEHLASPAEHRCQRDPPSAGTVEAGPCARCGRTVHRGAGELGPVEHPCCRLHDARPAGPAGKAVRCPACDASAAAEGRSNFYADKAARTRGAR